MALAIMQDGSERIAYRDPAFPVYIRKSNLTIFPEMAFLCHWHEELELLVALKGHLCYNVNGTVVTIREGEAIFVNSRQLHYGFSSDRSDCDYLCICFQPQLLHANPEIWNRFVLPLLSSRSFTHLLLRPEEPEHRHLLNILIRMGQLEEEQEEGCEMQLMACLFSFWQGLFRLSEQALSEEVSTDANVLIQKKMLDYVRTHYGEKLSVDAIAASGGVCRTKCWQIFRKYLNQTPNDYVNSFRLEKGMQLLKSTRMSVTEIAQECGFSSGSYFTELFTRQKGCTPTQYRKR